MREKFLNGATVLMVCLAVASTAYSVLRQRELSTTNSGGVIITQQQADWRNYATGGHIFGPADAPVTIIEFADFQCPYCESLRWSIDTLRARHPRDVRFVFRHFPLPTHKSAIPAAAASECAGEQSRFEPMFNELFSHQDSLGVASFSWFAQSAGVSDLIAFEACMRRSHTQALIQDTTDATRLRLTGTPTLLINDLRVEGIVPLDSLEAYVLRARAASLR